MPLLQYTSFNSPNMEEDSVGLADTLYSIPFFTFLAFCAIACASAILAEAVPQSLVGTFGLKAIHICMSPKAAAQALRKWATK